eukprot:m.243007 g.243007  ORF g.243007 m.243007 type:complete len:394 (-) comp26764_c0_seq1:100-1281(-)
MSCRVLRRLVHTKPPKFLIPPPVIAEYAAMGSRPPSLRKILEFGSSQDPRRLIKSAQYLQRELPVRIAMCLDRYYKLPFIVGCNPHLTSLSAVYAEAFSKLHKYPPILTPKDEETFSNTLSSLIKHHTEVPSLLAASCLECRDLMPMKELASFITAVLKSRVGIRLLFEQQVALHTPIAAAHTQTPGKEEGQGLNGEGGSMYTGMIGHKVSPRQVAEYCIEVVSEMTRRKLGRAPRVVFDGDVDATFMYVPAHLEYILIELLKNAFRATTEHHVNTPELPPVCVTIAKSQSHVALRISDRGGGFPPSLTEKLWYYSYTTVDREASHSNSIFELLTSDENRFGVLAGQGFGLPMARVYAEYFGGSMQLVGMHGLGADAHVLLPRLDHALDQLFV